MLKAFSWLSHLLSFINKTIATHCQSLKYAKHRGVTVFIHWFYKSKRQAILIVCVLSGYTLSQEYDEHRSPNSCYCYWGDAQGMSGSCSAQPRKQVYGCCCLLVGFKLCLCTAHLSWCMVQPNNPTSEKSYFLKTSFSGVFVNLWNSRSDFISFQTFMMVLSSVRSFSCSASRSFRVCLWDGIIMGLGQLC